jgi:hypothetical protein
LRLDDFYFLQKELSVFSDVGVRAAQRPVAAS